MFRNNILAKVLFLNHFTNIFDFLGYKKIKSLFKFAKKKFMRKLLNKYLLFLLGMYLFSCGSKNMELANGKYCMEFNNLVSKNYLHLEIKEDSVFGTIGGTIEDKKNAYYTSYQGYFKGIKKDSVLMVEVVQTIENDKQVLKEQWIFRDSLLIKGKDQYKVIPCDKVDQSNAENANIFGKEMKVSWNIELNEKESEPKTSLFLSWNGKQAKIAESLNGEFAELEKEEYAQYKIPSTALTACSGFWGGLLQVYYAERKNEDELLIKIGFQDEGDAPFAFEKEMIIKTTDFGSFSSFQSPTLSEEEATELLSEAFNAYYYFLGGGDGKNIVRANGYRTLGSDLDTRQKLNTYLQQVFSAKAIALLTKDLKENNGKLSQLDADGGSIADWEAAIIEVVKDSPTEKTYIFNVPLGETDESIKENVKLVYEKGWKVDAPLPSF
ncbi:MAG: hypothetical protein EAZ97_15800 [Bacteroidetes bacterium]|nr:MAG: hypothetical protein EAZ97_15800 [Bacteroidota bacterium]